MIETTRRSKAAPVGTGEAYDAYKRSCRGVGLRGMTGRAFGDLLAELNMYSLIRCRVLSRGRYGRTREITIDLSGELVRRIYAAVQLNLDMQTWQVP